MFSSESISVIKDRIIKFVLVEADNFFISKLHENTGILQQKTLCPAVHSPEGGSCLTVEYGKDNTIYFSVLNNKRMYNLLSNCWQRYKNRVENENIKR